MIISANFCVMDKFLLSVIKYLLLIIVIVFLSLFLYWLLSSIYIALTESLGTPKSFPLNI